MGMPGPMFLLPCARYLSFRGPAPMPEAWASLRGPKVDTKLRQQLEHPLWVLTVFVVKWGLFWVLVLGMGFPPCFVSLSEAKQTHGVPSMSPGVHQIAVVKDI